MTSHPRYRVLLAGLAVAATALAGCSGHPEPGNPGSVDVTGAFGAPVTISVEGNLHVDGVRQEVLSPGDGVELAEGSPVLARITSFDSRTEAPVEGFATGGITLATVSKAGVGELAPYLVGQREGSRLLIQREELVAGDPGAVEIVVVDILYTNARGDAAPPPATPPVGMPGLASGEGVAPVLTGGGGPIPEFAVVPLVLGRGEQVAASDELVLNYFLVDPNGQTVDSSWTSGPVRAAMGDLMDGMRKGLVDQRVGSRVMILIPASQARGDSDLVAIVDILATGRALTQIRAGAA
ncbi:FKBP-type peptidyl-prolyl cis-trans isomerase [Actinotignum sp. GS-2025c]|uniref:FKBP-type peptidyl-prolyl cis-trans isomerase n=1 Tax=Actinotignum sp. GS-2025c TaxID=3427276 RepID=UPI003F48EACD